MKEVRYVSQWSSSTLYKLDYGGTQVDLRLSDIPQRLFSSLFPIRVAQYALFESSKCVGNDRIHTSCHL